MFTTIPRSTIKEPGTSTGQPIPEIINHRSQDGRWSTGHLEGHKTYDSIKQQRDVLIASEQSLKKRIKELEGDNEKLLEVYETTNTENTVLKSHMKHGPNAQKIKQLNKEVKELNSDLASKVEENQQLHDRIKELERLSLTSQNLYVESNWRKAVELGRARREERDAIGGTQGPFKDAAKKKKKMNGVSKESFETQDSRDLQIDNLEKETQILLNKIRLMKQNKSDIDYATCVDKGAVTRNKVVRDAINDKLDRDLDSFATRLQVLRNKAKSLKAKPGTADTESHLSRTISSGSVDGRKSIKQSVDGGTKSIVDDDDVVKTTPKPSKQDPNKSNPVTTKKKSGNNKIKASSVDLDRQIETEKEEDRITSKSVTPASTFRDGSPIVQHWDQLADRLIKTEKYGGLKSGQKQNNKDIQANRPIPKTAHTDRSSRVRSPQTLNGGPNSSYSVRSRNTEQPKDFESTVITYRPYPARITSTQTNRSERTKNKPKPSNKASRNSSAATMQTKQESMEHIEKVIEANEGDSEPEEDRRDESAYDAILADLRYQQNVHEKAMRTTSVSRQNIPGLRINSGEDEHEYEQLPTETNNDKSIRMLETQSRFSGNTLELL